jgi:beta-1,4-N-acetylglucosaminyltransferase
MESFRFGKRLIVVVNDSLMDNHQAELAMKLKDEGYLVSTTCRSVGEMPIKHPMV